jgi:bacterial/archaeal transporter family protein
MWVVFAFLSALMAALVAIFGKLGLAKMDSTLATTVRSVIMAAFLVLVSLALKKFASFSVVSVAARDWMFITAAGIAGALSWLFYFLALQTGWATSVVAIDRLSVVLVVLLAAGFLGEPLTSRSLLGVALMVVGAVLLIK